MKTAEEKAISFAENEIMQFVDLLNECTSNQGEQKASVDIIDKLTVLLKQQDRDTRNACSVGLLNIEVKDDGHMISIADARSVCMNVKAV